MPDMTMEPQMGLTFEQVWASLQETGRLLKEVAEAQKETDRKFQETDRQMKETERLLKENSAETERLLKESGAETNKAIKEMSARVDRVTQNVGGLNRSVGELVETLIAARLWEKFATYPYQLKRAYQRVPIYDEQNRLKTDIDILLADTEWCMAVEVKRNADNEDVDHHLRRMELIRRYPPAEVKDKRLLGAIAGGVMPPDTAEYAHKAGFFVLELAGESVALLDTPAGFAVREW